MVNYNESGAIINSLSNPCPGYNASDMTLPHGLYVYTRGEIPLDDRRSIVERSGGAGGPA